MDVLARRFGISDGALGWMADYLNGHSLIVRVSKCESDEMILQYGVHRGSVLGPGRFIQYAEDVSGIIASHRPHCDIICLLCLSILFV